MCGIAALISSEPARHEGFAAPALQQLGHRGPDNQGVWHAGPVTLAHTRLSLLDLSTAGDQPMESEHWVLTYNGELYNHIELRADHQLQVEGTSDTATLLALLELYGINCLPLLRGMWAFVALHKPSGFVFAATDPFGIKPLHLYQHEGTIAFASTPSALLHLQPRWKLNMGGMLEFFTVGGTSGVWQGIERVPGGTLISAWHSDRGVHRTHERWYEPTYRRNAEAVLPAVLEQAMRQVQLADVPVGLFYSGGVDSSVVASYMPAGAPAFHLDGPETAQARMGAAHYGLAFHLVEETGTNVAAALAHIARATGEPTMAGHIPYVVSQRAAEHVKAAISANGADELFFGYPRTLKGQYEHMFRAPNSFTMRHTLPGTHHLPQVYALHGQQPAANSQWPACAKARWAELMYYIQFDLNPTLDAASMAHSLEVRVPFLDQDLVECALSLPHAWHGTKRVLREHLASTGLPAEVYERPKLGFSMATGNSQKHVAYQNAALAHLKKHYRFAISPKASGRDKSYLTACAAGWYAFEQEHENIIER